MNPVPAPPLPDSRAALVAGANEARRQLERDLHDGAQQRFVLASLYLARAFGATRDTPAEPLVAEARMHVEHGLAELRELARGIHPAILRERGLAQALEGLAARSPVPVVLHVTPERVTPVVEAAAYFSVAEALTNVAKHAHATHARVTVGITGGILNCEIFDDGVGGADATAGSGLRGLADRTDSLGGTLSIDSPRGGPTSVQVSLPESVVRLGGRPILTKE
jgi:signal transduction histidine kinase